MAQKSVDPRVAERCAQVVGDDCTQRGRREPILATLPLAAASWFLVERHAMRLKRRLRRSTSAAEPAFVEPKI